MSARPKQKPRPASNARTLTTREPLEPATSFRDSGLPRGLVTALIERGFEEPFAIQAATLPNALAGDDILARAQTGSGKTLGFGLPMLATLVQLRDHGGKPRRYTPRAIVLVPTRELAAQVARELTPLAGALALHGVVVTGGAPYGPQRSALHRGVDYVVATPGRLIDLIDNGDCELNGVEISILDEADHMCELGFLEPMQDILRQVPTRGQRMLFSATLDGDVDTIAAEFMPSPVLVATDPEIAQIDTMSHHIVEVPDWRRKRAVIAALANGSGRTLIFVRSQLGADRVADELKENGIPAGSLHGGLTQAVRTRALKSFSDGYPRVLVATDVAARGIHVDDIDVVVHSDPPGDHKSYVHRSGRTARAGAGGTVVTVSLTKERRGVDKVLKSAGVEPAMRRELSDTPDVVDLVGPPAPPQPPRRQAPEPTYADRSRSGRPRADRNGSDRSRSDRPRTDQTRSDRPSRDSNQYERANESRSNTGWSKDRRPNPARNADERPSTSGKPRRSDNRADSRSDDRYDSRSDSRHKSTSKPSFKSSTKPAPKLAPKSSSKFAAKAPSKGPQKAWSKPAPKSAAKSGPKANGAPRGRG